MNDNKLMKSKAAPQPASQAAPSIDAIQTVNHESESALRAEIDAVCGWLESLDAVASGDVHWNDGNTDLSATKDAPKNPQKGSTPGSRGAK